jgi:hypothetical protein
MLDVVSFASVFDHTTAKTNDLLLLPYCHVQQRKLFVPEVCVVHYIIFLFGSLSRKNTKGKSKEKSHSEKFSISSQKVHAVSVSIASTDFVFCSILGNMFHVSTLLEYNVLHFILSLGERKTRTRVRNSVDESC